MSCGDTGRPQSRRTGARSARSSTTTSPTRASQLARGGIEALLSDLHPELQLVEHSIQIVRRPSSERDLAGAGLLLIPCAFAWPHIIADLGTAGTPSLTYGPRGIGLLWDTGRQRQAAEEEDALGALLGRTRAAILTRLALPRSTTDLALKSASAPAIAPTWRSCDAAAWCRPGGPGAACSTTRRHSRAAS